MRKVQKNIIKTILIAFSVGIFASSVYAGVAFVGDFRQPGFASVKKLLPTIFTCPDGQGWYQGKCVNKCDRSSYPFTDTPDETKGTVGSCIDAWGTYFAYTDCHNGWDLIEGDCTPTDCSDFPYTSNPETTAGTVTSCKSASDTFYKYTSCHEGWDLLNGRCNIHTCNSTTYPYTSDPGSDAGTIVTCKSGVSIQYGYSDCRAGWDKSNGYCNIHVCDANTYPFNSQPSNTIGTVISCLTGSDTKYGYSACTSDYELKNGQCEAKCSLTATSLPANCTTATDSCEKNGNTYYSTACATCNSGYIVSGNSCVVNPCTNYAGSNTGCQSYTTCKSGTTNKYNCTKCKNGYHLSGNQCSANECNGFGSTSSTITGCSGSTTSCLSGTTTKYKCSSCYTGYDLASDGTCSRNCWYSNTSTISHCAQQDSCILGSSSGEKRYYSSCQQCESGYTFDTHCSSSGMCRSAAEYYYYKGTIIGVIVKKQNNKKYIMALTNINANGQPIRNNTTIKWSNSEFFLVDAGVTDGSGYDYDGEGNTAKILAYAQSHGFSVPAFEAVRKYAPSVCENGSICGPGKWHIPGSGEVRMCNGGVYLAATTNAGGVSPLSPSLATSSNIPASQRGSSCKIYQALLNYICDGSCGVYSSGTCTSTYGVRPFLVVNE